MRTEQRAIRRTGDTRVGGCLSGRRLFWDLSRFFRIVREYPRTKIQLRSSNGSEVRGASPRKEIRAGSHHGSQLKLRTASFTPHFHAGSYEMGSMSSHPTVSLFFPLGMAIRHRASSPLLPSYSHLFASPFYLVLECIAVAVLGILLVLTL